MNTEVETLDAPVNRSDPSLITDEQKGTLYLFMTRTNSAFGSSRFGPADIMVWAHSPGEALNKLAAYLEDLLAGVCQCTIIDQPDKVQLQVDNYTSGSSSYFQIAQPGIFTMLE